MIVKLYDTIISHLLISVQRYSVAQTIYTTHPRGKLTLIPTPIGNLQDLSPNMFRALFTADLIGCQDRKMAGSLYTLIKNKGIRAQIETCFGKIGLTDLISIDQQIDCENDADDATEHQFYNYSNMNDKQRRKILSKMNVSDQKLFKIQYLKYRARKIMQKNDEFVLKNQKDKFQDLYGIQSTDFEAIERQIHNTRVRKGRGLLIPLNTYSQTKLFDLVRISLQNKHVAIISDAGMPCISDPGWRMVRNIRQKMPKVPINIIYGPSCVSFMILLGTLSASRENKYYSLSGRFQGFADLGLSLMDSRDQVRYRIKQSQFSIHFINSKKLKKKVIKLEKLYGSDHRVLLANELTKQYQRKYHGTIGQLNRIYTSNTLQFQGKGELTYLLYKQSNEEYNQKQQQKINKNANIKSNSEQKQLFSQFKTVSITKFIQVMKQVRVQLSARQQSQLVCSIFGVKMQQVRKQVQKSINNISKVK